MAIPSRRCKICGKRFYKLLNTSKIEWEKYRRFCSVKCANKNKLGRIPWNKGKIGIMVAWNKGIPFSEESRRKMSEAKRGKKWTEYQRKSIIPCLLRGIEHPNWRGEKVGYMALHSWVKRNYGKATFCERCGIKSKPKITSRGKPMRSKKNYFEWANLSGQYKRERKDWAQLCVKCHSWLDHGGHIDWKMS